jgi:hypothetical protein
MKRDKCKGGLICISGCPRSGTSINMEIQRVVHGDAMILGEKFPQEKSKEYFEKFNEELKEKLPHIYRVRNYIKEKKELEGDGAERGIRVFTEESKDMNPDGFWEMNFTIKGINYSPQHKELFKKLREGEKRICKVVSQGLLSSDPYYIDKIVYSIRHPRAVAKSQERLYRVGPSFKSKEGLVNLFDNITIHCPKMFISVTCEASNFFLENPDIPVLFIHFEDLVKNPKDNIDKIGEFVGFGDYSKAYKTVKPKLNRSKHEDIENDLWEDAEFVYEKFCKAAELKNKGDNSKAEKYFKEILEYISNPKRKTNKENNHWPCYRAKKEVNYKICESCISNKDYRDNMKKRSESIPGKFTRHWSEEPCLFECGFNPDREEYLTIKESIENNFWNEDE